MGRYRTPNGADELYRRHLQKTPFAQNPRNNRFVLIQRMYEMKLTELAVNRFKWTGLPDEIDVRFLENILFYQALVVFYKDEEYGKYMALRGGSSGPLNYNDNPIHFQTVGPQYISKFLNAFEDTVDKNGTKIAGPAVPIWANNLRVPDLTIVEIYASKLAEIDRTLEINTKNARQTKFIMASENQKLSMVNINRQVDEGQDVISVNNSLPSDLGFIQALDLGVDSTLISALRNERNQAWGDCLSLLGIDNTNQDKKERLVEAEATGNADAISNMRYVNLNARRQAADLINRTYELNISVEYWTDKERNANLGVNDTEESDKEDEDLD